jgi:hypothetical protein
LQPAPKVSHVVDETDAVLARDGSVAAVGNEVYDVLYAKLIQRHAEIKSQQFEIAIKILRVDTMKTNLSNVNLTYFEEHQVAMQIGIQGGQVVNVGAQSKQLAQKEPSQRHVNEHPVIHGLAQQPPEKLVVCLGAVVDHKSLQTRIPIYF